MDPRQITIDLARMRLQSGEYQLLTLNYDWGDYHEGVYYPRAIADSDITTIFVGLFYLVMSYTSHHGGFVVAPTKLAFLYALTIPGARIIDVDHQLPLFVWKDQLLRRFMV